MKRSVLLLLIALAGLGVSRAQSGKYTLSGHLRDQETGEDLIGAVVYIEETGDAVAANLYGFYSITLPGGDYRVRIQSMGYPDTTISVSLNKNTTLDLRMAGEDFVLEEVVVSETKPDQNVSSVEMSTVEVTTEQIRKMPQLLGEVDVIRSIQLLPGVSTVGEGATGFNVRGGNIDQNLVLLDEGTVFNSSHLFGFFSVFNADAVKDVKLYKGGIPARYGGRLSSVLDVRQREGSDQKFQMRGGIGLLSSRLTVEAPIKKDKGSFLIAGRRSYADLFLKLSPTLRENVVYFYDLNVKGNYRLNENNRIFLSGYLGRDVFRFGDDFEARWGNITGTLRWNHVYSDKLFGNLSLIASNYDYNLGVPEGPQGFEWKSRIVNYQLKQDFDYYLSPNTTLTFGAGAIYYRFSPAKIEPTNDQSIFNPLELDKQYALEPSAYMAAEQKLGQFTVQYGLRASAFYRFGPQTVYRYRDGVVRADSTISDTSNYGSGDVFSRFFGLEPRVAVNFRINERSSVKVSYNRMRQNLHLVSNTTSATPVDVWTPAGPHIEPGISDQVAGGYFRNFKDNTFEVSGEVFYKWYTGVLDYVDGAQLFGNETLEQELLQGIGRSYGFEFLVRKQKGRWTGWFAYTLSKAERRVQAQNEGEQAINNGDWYAANWDKRHDVSLTLNYALTDKWELGANFAYSTGRPTTYPSGRFTFDGKAIPFYSERNNGRIPDYHRLDLQATYHKPRKEDKRWELDWIFGIYNVYGRRNAYSIFFRENPDVPGQTQAVRLSIFGSIIPSVTLDFKF